jgi:aryl-alcohol dehydrogenase-like predicted oxidoreductase
MHDAVTCAIPGAKRPQQVEENCAAADLPPPSNDTMEAVHRVYDTHIRALVHHRW